MPIWTLGHSHIPIARLIELLMLHSIDTIVDARSQPQSHFAPQYTRKALHISLERGGLTDRSLGHKLGGRSKNPQSHLPDGAIDDRRLAPALCDRDGLKCSGFSPSQHMRRQAVRSKNHRCGAIGRFTRRMALECDQLMAAEGGRHDAIPL
jgi:hypothetical protein